MITRLAQPNHMHVLPLRTYAAVVAFCWLLCPIAIGQEAASQKLSFQKLPPLPDPIGVAGPIVGVHKDTLIVAGGANFAKPDHPQLWELPKQYLTKAWLLPADHKQWIRPRFSLSQPVAYSSVVSIDQGVLVMGGEDASAPTNRTFLLQQTGTQESPAVVELDEIVPDLPLACTGGGAAVIDNYVFMVAGQVVDPDGGKRASRIVWRLDLRTLHVNRANEFARWEQVVAWPNKGPTRMFPLVAAAHDGQKKQLFVLGGRRFQEGKEPSDDTLVFGDDCWSFDPTAYLPDKFDPATGQYQGATPWKKIADAPVPLSAGTAIGLGRSQIIVPAYASGDLLRRQLNSGVAMKEFAHPGFPKTAYAYNVITDSWSTLGNIPVNQVTTPAVRWGDDAVLISGEIRPRVRTNAAWEIRLEQ